MSNEARRVFAENFTRLMQIRGIEQIELASALGVSTSAVSDWAKGKRYPRVDYMQRLADYFGVMMSDLTSPATPSTANAADEAELLGLYRSVNAAGRTAILANARGVAATPEYKKGGLSNDITA